MLVLTFEEHKILSFTSEILIIETLLSVDVTLRLIRSLQNDE